MTVVSLLLNLINLYILIIFGRIIMSFLRVGFAQTGMPPILEQVNKFLHFLTEPVMAPLRNILPPVRMGAGALDLSPIVILFLLRILQNIIASNVRF